MSTNKNAWLDPAVVDYVAARAAQPDGLMRDLVAETAEVLGDRSRMQIATDQGALIALLVRLIGARSAVEVGTFTGMSALCIARALPAGGRLVCCDVSEEYTAIGRRYWQRAGVADRIDLRIGPALDTLRSLPVDPPIDLAFIDADKSNYAAYYEELLARMRPSGLMLIDNTLWSGRVLDPSSPADDADTAALRRLNDSIAADERVESYLLPISDGLTLVRKR